MTPDGFVNVLTTVLAALAVLRRIELLESRMLDHERAIGQLQGRKA